MVVKEKEHNMKMKKTINILVSFLLCMSMMMLAACGESSANTSNQTAAASQTETKTEEKSEASAAAENKQETSSASEDVIVMKFSMPDSETSVAGQYIQRWADAVEEKTDGRVTVDIYWSGTLVSMPETYGAVLDGIADAGWSGPSMTSGMMPLSEVTALPYCGITSGVQGSAVCWDIITQNEAVAAEWEDFYVVSFHALGAVPIGATKEFSSIEDIKGLRFANGYKSVIDWLEQNGAIGMTVPNAELYENLSKNVIDGTLKDYQNISQWSLSELLKTVMDCGVNYSVMGIVMNKDFYNNLPADIQEIFDNELSGKEWSIIAGEMWRESDDTLRQETIDAGVNVIYPDKEMYESFVEAGKIACQNWIDSVGGEAQNVYDQMQEIIAGYGDQYDEYLPAWYADVVG